MSHDQHAVRITAVLGDMVMHPPDRFGDVAKNCAHLDLREQAVTCGDEDETLIHKCLRFLLNTRPVTTLPAATMNPKDYRQILGAFRGVDVYLLPGGGGLGVWKIPSHFGFGLRQPGGLELCHEDEQRSESED